MGTTAEKQRQRNLRELRNRVRRTQPDWIKTVAAAKAKKSVIMMPQESYAADYDGVELLYLADAIKYAGLEGVSIILVSEGDEAFQRPLPPTE